MANCLLVSYAGYPVMMSSFFPDNGLASLAASLKEAGHEVLVLDLNTVSSMEHLVPSRRTEQLKALIPVVVSGPDKATLEELSSFNHALEEDLDEVLPWLLEKIEREIQQRSIDLLGFKLWSGDGFVGSVKMAESLRVKYPRLKIVGGGPAVLTARDSIFDITQAFDALVQGEAEQAIVALAQWADGQARLQDAPNLILPGGKTTPRVFVRELDRLPPPLYSRDVYPSLAGDDHIKLFILDESRGCPMGCAFCIHQQASGSHWRLKGASRVADEIAEIQRQHGSHAYRLGGSYTPAKFYKELSGFLVDRRQKIRFSGFGHPSGVPEKHLALMAEAGCKSIFFGVESFHESDSEKLGKKLDPQKAKGVIRSCIDTGIVPIASIIYPIPGQSRESREANFRISRELFAGTRSSLMTQFPGLFPWTTWWDDMPGYGFELLCEPREFLRLSATYRIRHIIPPSMWEPLPYSMDGMDFYEYAGANTWFQKKMAAEGVVVNISDEMVLLADVLGLGLQEYRSRMQMILFSLDADRVKGLVGDFNRGICSHAG